MNVMLFGVVYGLTIWAVYHLHLRCFVEPLRQIEPTAPTFLEAQNLTFRMQSYYDEQADLIEQAFTNKMPVLAFEDSLPDTRKTYQEQVSEWHLEGVKYNG
jgi:hypothetical protein